MRAPALLVIGLSAALLRAQAWAEDPGNQRLLTHVREAYALPLDVSLSLENLHPSEMPGFDVATLKMQRGAMSQDQTIYISSDKRHYFLGTVQDIATNPDKERSDKIELAGAPGRGSPNAKVTVVEYSDFECPACKRAHDLVEKNLFKDYGKKVRLVYKYFPLTQIHPWSESAAIAAECGWRQDPGKYWALHDSLFDHQESINPQNVREKVLEFAKNAGFNSDALAQCYDKKESLDAVRKSILEGDSIGIASTPTILVNGHPVAGPNYPQIKALIDEFLAGRHARL